MAVVVAAVGEEDVPKVPIIEVMMDVVVSLALEAADDCVDEEELLELVDVELAASGTVCASTAQADELDDFDPT